MSQPASKAIVDETRVESKLIEHLPYETDGGIKMGVEDKDQNAFSNLLTLLNESGAAEASMIVIKDIYRNSHGMTVAQYRATAVAYGLYCFTLFNS